MLTRLERERGVIGSYGHAWRVGVVSDHVAWAERVGARIVRGALATWVVDDEASGRAYPVLCGDIVEIDTEDGPIDGRCGLLAVDQDELACEGHAVERRAYLAMCEAERAYLEREQDRCGR